MKKTVTASASCSLMLLGFLMILGQGALAGFITALWIPAGTAAVIGILVAFIFWFIGYCISHP